jgi:pilus assembly protein CpaB
MFRFIILFVALVAGGGAAWIAWTMRGGSADTSVLQAAAPTRDVLVASTDLVQGQVLIKENLRWQSWPESAVQTTYITRSARPDALATLAGAVLRGNVIAGEPIRGEKFAPEHTGLLSSILPSGKRAVAVRVTAENTAGGFILPNDRVDVLHTAGSLDKPEGQKDYTTRTILTNVPVLAIDQSLDDKTGDDKSKAKSAAIGKTATLELDPRQAEALIAAEAAGTLSLVLRSTADNADTAPPPSPTVSRLPRPEVFIVRGSSSASAVKAP